MEFNLWTVAEIASNVVDSALIILLASSVLKLRLQSKWFYLASIIILSIICTLANMYCTSLSQMLVVLWIFLFAFLLLFTEGSLKLKLIWSLLTQVIFFGVDMLYTSIFFRIMSDVPIEDRTGNTFNDHRCADQEKSSFLQDILSALSASDHLSDPVFRFVISSLTALQYIQRIQRLYACQHITGMPEQYRVHCALSLSCRPERDYPRKLTCHTAS